MHADKKAKKKKLKDGTKSQRLDVIFAGPLLFVPEVSEGSIGQVEVFAPCNGHPVGAVFLPGVIFTDAELDDPKGKRWPEAESFSMLDPHSYALELEQPVDAAKTAFPVSSIPESNHKVKPGRRLTGDWDLSIVVKGALSGWSTHRLAPVRDGLFHGADSPRGKTTASLQRLSYSGVLAADLLGAPDAPRSYLRENSSKGGSLIVIGEIPYQSTLLHERRAIDAIAKLAGLDLHLAETAAKPYQTRLMNHVIFCGLGVILG